MPGRSILFEFAEIETCRIFEEFAEMREVIEPERVSDHFHIGIAIHSQPFCLLYHPLLDMVAGRISRNLFDYFREVAGRHGKFVCIFGHLLHGFKLFVEFGVEAVEEPHSMRRRFFDPGGRGHSFDIDQEYLEKAA